MNENKYILSICIPTYNRLHLLGKTLETLLPQAEGLGVQVCISDNNSVDGTGAYLTGVLNQYSCLSINIQSSNVGLDKNMLKVISMGEGEYIYPLGDDDYLQENTIQLILEELKDHPDIVILNGKHTDANLQGDVLHLNSDFQGLVFSSPADAFPFAWDKMPFGSFLASRACFNTISFERYIGTSHAYTGCVWDVIASQFQSNGYCKIKFGIIPIVLLRGGSKSWRNDAARIMLYEIPLWFNLLMTNSTMYKENGLQCFRSYMRQQLSFKSLLCYRASGQLDSKLIKLLLPFYSPDELKRCFLVIKIPVAPLKLLMPALFGIKKAYRWLVN